MPPRSSWKGFIKLSLISVPVKAYTASVTSSTIRLNQLHKECHSPIKYRKVCPLHGEITNDEIVSGYQYAKGQYVEIDPEELEKLRPEGDKAVAVDGFIPPEAIDPIYYSGRTYYLVADGPVGQKPYALLHKAMVDKGLYATAQIVLSGKEQLVLLRPYERLLTMTILYLENQIKKPESFEDELADAELPENELRLAHTLMEATTIDEFNLSRYKDTYTEKLTELIEAKVEGKEIHVAPPAEEPTVVNLLDALKQSVEQAQEKKETEAAGKRGKKMAPSTRKRAAAKRKKKSG